MEMLNSYKIMSKNISQTIVSICRKLDIPFTSSNLDFHNFVDDAKKLVDMYSQLKGIIGDLVEIEDRHQINGLSKLIHIDLEKLDQIDHDLIKFAKQIKGQGKL